MCMKYCFETIVAVRDQELRIWYLVLLINDYIGSVNIKQKSHDCM